MSGLRGGGQDVRLPLTSRSIPDWAQHRTFVLDLGNDPVFDHAYLVDLAPDGIADDQWLGRLKSEADAAGRSGENEIARFKGHGLRKLGDLLPDVADQMPGIGVQTKLAVDKGPHP